MVSGVQCVAIVCDWRDGEGSNLLFVETEDPILYVHVVLDIHSLAPGGFSTRVFTVGPQLVPVHVTIAFSAGISTSGSEWRPRWPPGKLEGSSDRPLPSNPVTAS